MLSTRVDVEVGGVVVRQAYAGVENAEFNELRGELLTSLVGSVLEVGEGQSLQKSGRSMTSGFQCLARFSDSVIDEHVTSCWVSPPPAECCIENEPS